MAVHVRCAKCGHRFEADDSAIGQVARCPQCGHRIIIIPPSNRKPEPNTTPSSIIKTQSTSRWHRPTVWIAFCAVIAIALVFGVFLFNRPTPPVPSASLPGKDHASSQSTAVKDPVPIDKAKSPDLSSLRDFALVARQIRTGFSEGITFNDLDEKQIRLRDAYALMDRQALPTSLVCKAEDAFRKVRELREAWLKNMHSDAFSSAPPILLAEPEMSIAGTALDSFLAEYDRSKSR